MNITLKFHFLALDGHGGYSWCPPAHVNMRCRFRVRFLWPSRWRNKRRRYDAYTKETLVRYGVDHMGFSEFWGTFPGATGTLAIDPRAIGATEVDVKVPIARVETTNRELNRAPNRLLAFAT